MINGPIQEEDITLVNVQATKTGALKYIKQILTDIKGDIDKNTIIVEDFNTLLISVDRSSRQKVNKAAMVHNRPNGFIDIQRTSRPKAEEYTFFSSAHETSLGQITCQATKQI